MDPDLIRWASDLLWWLLFWVIALFLLVGGLYMTVGPILRQGSAQARVARALRRASLPALNDLVLRGPRGGLHQVDHVVRLPTGLVVLETCMRTGSLAGTPRSRVWRQSLGLDIYHFGNPLRRLERSMAAVRDALSDLPSGREPPLVTGQVLVPARARFGRGRPDGVSPLSTFLSDLEEAASRTDVQTDPALEEAWQALARAGLARGAAETEDWTAGPRRVLRHLLADHRTATGLVSACCGAVLLVTLWAGSPT